MIMPRKKGLAITLVVFSSSGIGINLVAGENLAILPPFDGKMKLDHLVSTNEIVRAPQIGKDGQHLVFHVSKKKIIDTLDAPRFYPLIGPAQLRQTRWQ